MYVNNSGYPINWLTFQNFITMEGINEIECDLWKSYSNHEDYFRAIKNLFKIFYLQGTLNYPNTENNKNQCPINVKSIPDGLYAKL